MTWPIRTTVYLHADKDSNYDKAAALGLGTAAAKVFAGCCYEIEISLEVYEDGSANMTHVDGIPLSKKLKAT